MPPLRPGSFAVTAAAVVIAGGRLGNERVVRAMDSVTGNELWSAGTGADDTLVAAGTDVVYLGSGARGTVEARGLRDGAKLWKRTLLEDRRQRGSGPPWKSLIAHPDGVLAASNDDTRFFALDRATGSTVVDADLMTVITGLMNSKPSSPVATADVGAWDALRGSALHAQLENPTSATGSSAAVSDRSIVVSALRRPFGAIEIAAVVRGGSSPWRRTLRLPAGPVAVSLPTPGVLLVHGGNRLRRLSLSTGEDMWIYDLPQASSPDETSVPTALPVGENLLVSSSGPSANGTINSSVDLIDAATGERRARARSAGIVSSGAGSGVVIVQGVTRYRDPVEAPRLLRPSIVGATFNVPTASAPVGPPIVLADAAFVFASKQPVFCG